jgi:hypothetical protein
MPAQDLSSLEAAAALVGYRRLSASDFRNPQSAIRNP